MTAPAGTPLVVLQNNHVQALTSPMVAPARARGILVHDVSSGEHVRRRPVPDAGGPWGPILIIGSSLFPVQWGQARPDLARWILRDDVSWDAALWAERMGGRMLNAGGRTTTIGAFSASTSGPMHVRPRDAMKLEGVHEPSESLAGARSLAAQVLAPAEVAALGIDPATPVWISPPRTIQAEVRTWMIDGRAVTGSTYRIDGAHKRRSSHPFVAIAAEAAARDHVRWRPARHYVVDHALTDDGWLVVEYNPIHSSGWYDADPGAVLDAFIATEGARPPMTRETLP